MPCFACDAPCSNTQKKNTKTAFKNTLNIKDMSKDAVCLGPDISTIWLFNIAMENPL
jgi:hypothetical protein